VAYTLEPGAQPYAEAIIKNSRFVARLGRAECEEAAVELIASAREIERGAVHHCFAYVIGDESRIERSSDDGEPGGTAGVPILNVLKARDLVNVAAVVSRYYGGVKLGAGGLVRAYGGTVATAIEGAELKPRRRWEVLRLAADHADAGWIEAELRRRGFEVTDVEYGERAVITLIAVDTEPLIAAIDEITSGRGEYTPAGHVWR
jgi:uncharacterized YigZ family protein